METQRITVVDGSFSQYGNGVMKLSPSHQEEEDRTHERYDEVLISSTSEMKNVGKILRMAIKAYDNKGNASKPPTAPVIVLAPSIVFQDDIKVRRAGSETRDRIDRMTGCSRWSKKLYRLDIFAGERINPRFRFQSESATYVFDECQIDNIAVFMNSSERRAAASRTDGFTENGASEKIEGKEVQLSYYPQDPSVGEPEITNISADGVTPGPDNSRIDTQADVKPDDNGNFILSPEDPGFIDVQTFACANGTIQNVQTYLGRKIYWIFGKPIMLFPDAGEAANAYYERDGGSLNFFHFKDKKTGVIIFTGNSLEIVSHETGHALLDGLKPYYLDWTRESMAIHEVFGDVTGMLTSLQNKGIVDMFLRETGGDFRKENVIARMGEQMGLGLYGRPYTKLAINSFTYTDPISLPEHPPAGELGGEPHSFAQLLVGTVYDIMEGIFNINRSSGMPPDEALMKMRDTVGKLFYKGVDFATQWKPRYRDIAIGMLKADEMGENGKYRNLLLDIFKKRKILKDTDIRDDFELSKSRAPLVTLDSKDILNYIGKYGTNMGIPDDVRITMETSRKYEDGSEIRDVTFTRDILLTGPEYGKFSGSILDMKGGISLMMGKGKDIRVLSQSQVRENDVDCIKKELRGYIRENRIKFYDSSFKGKPGKEDLFDDKGRPYIGYTTWENGRMKIERSPIIE